MPRSFDSRPSSAEVTPSARPAGLTFETFLPAFFALQERVQREVYGFRDDEIAERNAEPGRTEDAREYFARLGPDHQTPASVRATLTLRWDPRMIGNMHPRPGIQAARVTRWAAFAPLLVAAFPDPSAD